MLAHECYELVDGGTAGERMKDWESTWTALCEQLRETGLEVLRAAPESELARAEGLRYVSRLFRYAVHAQLEPRAPARPRISFEAMRVGGDNPDYRYGSAPLAASLQYRLRGRLNDAARLGIGTYSGGLGTGKGLACTGYVTSDALAIGPDGAFELLISAGRAGPEPGQRSVLPMQPDTNALLIREMLLQPGVDRPAEFALECLEPGPGGAALDADTLHAGLTRTPAFVAGIVRQFLRWTAAFEAHPNAIRPLDPSLLAAAQGDTTTRYLNGYFRLPSGEHALEIRFEPPACEYWNLQLCNHWLESLDTVVGAANHNHRTAKREPDGSVRFVVALRDPGIGNWLDAAGHLEGGIAMRLVGAETPPPAPEPSCRLVLLNELSA
jgi:hypothetical protein